MSTANALATELAPSTEANSTQSKPAYGTLSFDFGTNQSPVESGMFQVSDTMQYSPDRGYGLTKDATGVDRGLANDEHRDFIAGKHPGFRVDLPNGIYQVEMTLGDPTSLRDRMQVVINGQVRDTITTLSKEPVTTQYTVTVTDNQLVVEWNDLGGASENVAVNSLSVTALDPNAPLPEDNPTNGLPQKPVMVISTHGYTSPQKSSSSSNPLANWIGSQLGNSVTSRPPVTEWIYELAREMAKATKREGLGNLNGNVQPVALPKIEDAMDDAALLKLQKGSKDFFALDWAAESSAGTPDGIRDMLDGNVYNEREHRKEINRASNAIVKMVEARLRQELAKNPNFRMDLLFVAHSYGTNVNRDAVFKLKDSPLASHLDFVKVVELDHVSLDADTDAGEIAKTHDKFFWFHPELTALGPNGTPFVDSVTHLYQTEGLAFTGVLEGQLTLGQPIDGEVGGGPLGFFNRQVRVFDVGTGQELDRFRNRDPLTGKIADGELRDLVYSKDGRFMAIVGDDGTLRLRDAITDVEKLVINASKAKITDVEFLGDGQHISTVGVDGKVRIFRLTDGVEVWKGEHQGAAGTATDAYAYHGATRVTFSADGSLMVTAGTGKYVKIWLRQAEGEAQYVHVQSLRSHGDVTNALAFGADGTLVTGGADKQLKLFRPGADGVYSEVQSIAFTGTVNRAVFSSDGRTLAIAAGRNVEVWRAGQDGKWLRVQSWKEHVDTANALAFTPDGKRLATGGQDRTIFIYDLQTGSKVRTLNIPMLGVRNLSFNANGTRLSAVYNDLNGGPVNDINVTDIVKDRVGFFENVGARGTKHHTEVPFVYIDDFVKKDNDNFFEARLKDKAEYGDFEAVDLNQPATIPVVVSSDFVNSDLNLTAPWLDQLAKLHTPEILQKLADITITGETAITLDGRARDADGDRLQWTAKSLNLKGVIVTIVDGKLNLRPIAEGTAIIELTVTDGTYAAQQTFKVTMNGQPQRDQSSALNGRLNVANKQQNQVADAIDAATKLTTQGNALIASGQKELKKTDAALVKANDTLAAKTKLKDDNAAAVVTADKAVADAQSKLDKSNAAVTTAKATAEASKAVETAAIKTAKLSKDAADKAKKAYDAVKPSNPKRAGLYADWQAKKAIAETDAAAKASATTRREADDKALVSVKKTRDANQLVLDRSTVDAKKCRTALTDAEKAWATAKNDVTKLTNSRAAATADVVAGQAKLTEAASKVVSAREVLSTLKTELAAIKSDLTHLQQTSWADGLGLKGLSDTLAARLTRQAKLTTQMEALPK